MAYSDEEIQKVVLDQLSWDSRVGWSDVIVKVFDGQVTLEGTVPSYVARQAAEADALQVPGVIDVNNKTVIKFPGQELVPDEEIQARLLNRYLWNPNVDASQIDVSVKRGVVYLRGIIDEYWKKMRAEEIAYDINGVLHVNNELVVVPSNEFADKVIAEEIITALERSSIADPDRVDINVDNGRVTLNGTPRTIKELNAVYHIARHTRGVKDVVNLLRVQRKAA